MSQRLKANVDDSNVEEDNGVIEKKDDKEKKGSGCSYKRAKKVVVSPFNELYKRYKTSSSCSSNSHKIPMLSINSTRNSNYFSCLCMSKPQTLDPNYEGIDPNDPSVGYDYIKSLIEKNDFYAKESNTHVGN